MNFQHAIKNLIRQNDKAESFGNQNSGIMERPQITKDFFKFLNNNYEHGTGKRLKNTRR